MNSCLHPRQASLNSYVKNNPGIAYLGPLNYPQLTSEVAGAISPWIAARVYDYTRLAVLLMERHPAAIHAVATRLKTGKRTGPRHLYNSAIRAIYREELIRQRVAAEVGRG